MKKKLIAVLSIICLLILSACAPTNNNATQETYIMDYALDAAAYCSYVNKEIDACTNQLTTLMLLTDQVKDGEYPAADCLKSAEYAVEIIKACYEQVDIMPPPAQYADTRVNVLRCMDNSKRDVESLINELSKSPVDTKNLESINSLMQGDYIALSAEFNVFYE